MAWFLAPPALRVPGGWEGLAPYQEAPRAGAGGAAEGTVLSVAAAPCKGALASGERTGSKATHDTSGEGPR